MEAKTQVAGHRAASANPSFYETINNTTIIEKNEGLTNWL